MFAGAAFTDASDIAVDSEAVDTLVALGVIKGYADGSFKPEATVTRAEMAKMIYVLRTGKDDASAYAAAASKFTDLNGSSTAWAAGYIKYCEALGIIAGKNATTFDPAGNVTGEEAAKMLLVTLGYNAEKAGLVGTTWAKTTIALADENGLLDSVTAPLSLALPRQYAAMMMYNSVNAPTVVWRDDAYTSTNYQDKDNLTIGEKYMGLKTAVGTLSSITKDKDTYKVQITQTADQEEDSTGTDASFTKVAKDYSALKNQTVKVLYKKSDNVYGIFATQDSSVLNGLLGDFGTDGDKLKFDGSKYSIVADTKVDEDGTEKSLVKAYVDAVTGTAKAADAKVLLNKDDKVASMEVSSYMVGQVTYVGKDYVNVGLKVGTASKFSGYSKLDADSCSSDISGLKKDDYVIITNNEVADKLDAVKAEMVSGLISSTKDSSNEVKIDGNWYKSALASNAKLALGNDVNVVLKGNYVTFVDDVKEGSKDVALLVEAAKTSGIGAKLQADLLFADGKREVVSVKEEAGKTDVMDGDENMLVTYAKSGDKYELKKVADSTNMAGHDDLMTVAANSYVDGGKILKSDKSTLSYIDSGATIFLKAKDDYKVVTGADMKKWGTKTEFEGKILTDDSNGFDYAKIGFVNTGTSNPTGSDKTYAYIFDVELTKESDENVMVYSAFNGTEDVEIKVKEDSASVSEGDVIEYTVDADGYASYVDTYKDLKAGALTGKAWDGKGKDGDVKITLTGAEAGIKNYKVDKDDTIVLFIDTDGKTGSESSDPQLASKIFENDGITLKSYTKNVAIVGEEDQNLKVIVIDLANEIKTDLFS